MADDIFHPCPGKGDKGLSQDTLQGAWMKIVLTEGDGYDRTTTIKLSQADLHNLIVLCKNAEKEVGTTGDTHLVWQELAERLDRAFYRSVHFNT